MAEQPHNGTAAQLTNEREPQMIDDIKDLDLTSRGSNEPWGFTPSLLDPNSFAFSQFANQPPQYYTPTPNDNQMIEQT